jgi:glycerol-1-phosphate dehydrogenase [NAD(P)+]
MKIIEAGAAMLDGVAPKLPGKDRDAVSGLTESLMLSGFAMAVAGSSSPASGGEHLISHFIDMTAHSYDLPYDFHGCQVGVGTLTTAHFYERFLEMSPDDVDIDAAVLRLTPWDDYDAMLRERFDVLYDAVVKHARPGYPTPEELRSRLESLVDQWDEIRTAVKATLRTRQQIEDELAACDAPIRFAHLGIERERARRAIVHSKDIRNRYTILHLAWELGTLNEWADEALDILWE